VTMTLVPVASTLPSSCTKTKTQHLQVESRQPEPITGSAGPGVPRKSHAGPGHVVTVLALSTGVALRLLLRLATVTVTVAVPVPVRQHQAARYGLQAGASKAQAPPSIIV
jgi:hypothetical protein